MITDYKEHTHGPDPSKLKHSKHLLPTVLTCKKFSFIVDGAPGCYANAFRRVFTDEIPYVHFEATSVACSSEYVIPELIAERMKMIPLHQSAKVGARARLYAANKVAGKKHGPKQLDPTLAPMSVTTAMITHEFSKPMFDETYVILDLPPGHDITVEMTTAIQSAHTPRYGMCTPCGLATSVPLDVVMFDQYTGKGEHSTECDPRKHLVSAMTDGTIEPRLLCQRVCDLIIERVKRACDATATIAHDSAGNNMYVLSVPGETDTIGALVCRAILDSYPGATSSWRVDVYSSTMEIRVRTTEELKFVMANARDGICDKFTKMKQQFA